MRNQHIFSLKSLQVRNIIPNFADEIGEDRLRSAIEASFIALAGTIIAVAKVQNENLCTRADVDVQGVESGSSILIMKNDDGLSEFTLLDSGVDSSFTFSSLWVLPEPYSLDAWIKNPRHS